MLLHWWIIFKWLCERTHEFFVDISSCRGHLNGPLGNVQTRTDERQVANRHNRLAWWPWKRWKRCVNYTKGRQDCCNFLFGTVLVVHQQENVRSNVPKTRTQANVKAVDRKEKAKVPPPRKSIRRFYANRRILASVDVNKVLTFMLFSFSLDWLLIHL